MLTLLKKVLLIILILCIAVWAYAYIKLEFEEHEYHQPSEAELSEAQRYLEGKLYPSPEGWRWGEFITSNKVMLRIGRVDAANAKGTIIFLPGFTGTMEMSMDVISGLHAAGFNVAGVEYRGQGGSYRPLSNPEKGYIESFELLANEVAQFAEANRDTDLPLFFYSISKGAHITMRMAAMDLVEVDAYALVVPMIKINPAPFDYDQVAGMAKILGALGLGDMYAPGQTQWPDRPLIFGEAEGCNANPKTAQIQNALFALNPDLRTRGTTVRWINQTVASTEKLLEKGFMSKLTEPVIVFTAGDDRLVSTEAIQQFCEQLSDCQESHFKEARHCINPESAERRDEILRQSIRHFESTITNTPGSANQF